MVDYKVRKAYKPVEEQKELPEEIEMSRKSVNQTEDKDSFNKRLHRAGWT